MRPILLFALLPLALAACRAHDAAPSAAGADSAASATAPGSPPAAAAPAAGNASSEESVLAAAHDSIQEAELYHRRQQDMESLQSCMTKANAAPDPQQRLVLTAACQRGHPASR